MADLPESASQTAGPYVHIGCTPGAAGLTGQPWPDLGASLFTGAVPKEAITVEGRVLDGAGEPLLDALVEIWQADGEGRFAGEPGADPGFTGFGRAATDGERGWFRFQTLRPGPVPWRGGGMQAPHISFWIVARGINLGLHTRGYFEAADDPVLSLVPEERRRTLMLAQVSELSYRIDIKLQGTDETVFFST